MITIHNNPVEKYLKQHSDKKLSLRKIKNDLNISKGAVFFLAMTNARAKATKVSHLSDFSARVSKLNPQKHQTQFPHSPEMVHGE